MGKDRLEDYIKEQLVNHESTVDSDAIWNRLQKNKRKKRPYLWLPAMGLLLVASLIGIYLLTITSSEIDLKNNESIQLENKKLVEIDLPESDIPLRQSKDIIFRKNMEIDRSLESNKAQIVKTKVNAPGRGSSQYIGASNNVITEPIISDQSDSDFKVTYGLIGTQDFKNFKSQEKFISSRIENLSRSSFFNNTDKYALKVSPLRIDLLHQLQTSLLSHTRQQDILEMDISVLTDKDITKDPWQSYAGFTMAYYRGIRTLQNLDSLNSTLDLRNAGESFLEAWGLGFEYVLEHKSGLFLGSGVVYRQINDQAILSETKEELLVPTPVELQSAGFGFLATTEIERVRYHKLSMIDVPLYAGYKFRKGRNSFSLQTGINLNLRTYSRGQVIGSQLSDNGEYTAAFRNVKDEQLFRNRVGWSSQIEFGYHRLINDSFELGIKPTFRYYSSGFNDETNNLIEQRYKHFGLKLTFSKRL